MRNRLPALLTWVAPLLGGAALLATALAAGSLIRRFR